MQKNIVTLIIFDYDKAIGPCSYYGFIKIEHLNTIKNKYYDINLDELAIYT